MEVEEGVWTPEHVLVSDRDGRLRETEETGEVSESRVDCFPDLTRYVGHPDNPSVPRYEHFPDSHVSTLDVKPLRGERQVKRDYWSTPGTYRTR